VKGAIRFLKARASEDSVCTANVFVAGVSAGGFNALAAAMLDVDSEKPLLAGSLPPAPGPANTLGYCHGYFNLPGAEISLERPDLGSIEGTIAQNGFTSRVKGVANYYGGMMENLLEQSNGPMPALYLFHQTNDVVVACNYTRLLAELSYGCLDPFGFLGCQHIWNTPKAYGSCGIETLIENGNYPINYTSEIIQNGAPNCLADPPGHSLLSTYARAKNAATFFAPLILEETSCFASSLAQDADDFRLFPNPVVDQFQVKSSKHIETMSLFSLSGQHLRSFSKAEVESGMLSLDGLAAGSYLVMLKTSSGQLLRARLVKALE
jgi:hypothetical protein